MTQDVGPTASVFEREAEVKVPLACIEQAVAFYSVVFAAKEVSRSPVHSPPDRVELKVRETTLLVCAQANNDVSTVSKDGAIASRPALQLEIDNVNMAASLACNYDVHFQVAEDSSGLRATLTDPFGFNWVLTSGLPSHPPYPQMILEVISALDTKNKKKVTSGHKTAVISDRIKVLYGKTLPPLHPILVTAGLKRLCEAKRLVNKKGAYFLVDNDMQEESNAPATSVPASLSCHSGPNRNLTSLSSGTPDTTSACGPPPKKAKVASEVSVPTAASGIAADTNVEKPATYGA